MDRRERTMKAISSAVFATVATTGIGAAAVDALANVRRTAFDWTDLSRSYRRRACLTHENIRMEKLEVHAPSLRNTFLAPLRNGLGGDIEQVCQCGISAETINKEGVGMVHATHCNYSCTPNANHSCNSLCNHRCMSNKTIADQIKAIRLSAGDSPAAAAKKIGVSRQGYLKWELGATENMKLANLLTFCDKYNVNVEQFMRGVLVIEDEIHSASAEETYPAEHKVPIGYSATPIQKLTVVNEPDPEERALIEGFRVADHGLKRAMLAIAREAHAAFEKRSEKND